jgi:Type VII secretion system ESX-1, transport TM domain B
MATDRDVAEAHSFVRRRLVAALLSGAPGGHEVERASAGWAAVAGIALAVLLLALATVSRLLSGTPWAPDDTPPQSSCNRAISQHGSAEQVHATCSRGPRRRSGGG